MASNHRFWRGPFIHNTCAAKARKSLPFARSYIATRISTSCSDFRLSIQRLGRDLRHTSHRRIRRVATRALLIRWRRNCDKITRRAKFRLTCRANHRYQLAPSFPGRGAYHDRHETRERMWWTRQRRRAKRSQGECLVSDRPARRTNGARCVRQNRVVPTPVAGVKLPVVTSIRPDSIPHQAGSDGDKTNSSPRRTRHKP